MNKSILINVGWIAMAGVTFAVGRMTAGSGETVVAVNESGRSQKGLTSIIEMSPNDSKKAAVDADGDFLSKYLEGESGVLSKEGMAKAMRLGRWALMRPVTTFTL